MALSKLKLPKKPYYIKFADNVDFYTLFKRINQYFDTCFFLESLGPESYLSRYSIIGFDPKHIISASPAQLAGKNDVLTIDHQRVETSHALSLQNPYQALRQIIPQNIIARAYCGGLIGYLSYGCVNYFEPALKVKTHNLFPQFKFGFYTDGLVLDKMTGEISYFYYTHNRLNIIKKISQSKIKNRELTIKLIGDSLDKKQHTDLVHQAKQEILAGNTFQCQIGFKTEYQIKGDDLKIYSRLRKINPSPWMYYVKFGKLKIIGASPELLFRLSQREMETYPLAGTIRRGKSDIADRGLARKLLNDEKEIAEHNMLVDLHRNDLGRVAEFGTVKVRRLMDIKKFSHVQHISSEIAGVMAQGQDMFSVLASNFPAGTLSGAPKIESIKIIDRLEPDPRGPYGGALGHFEFNGDCMFAIPIRSLFIFDDYAYTQNSSGIVYDSVAGKEYQEIGRKGKAMENVLTKFKNQKSKIKM
jgi:anthranilate synthase component 1